MNNEELKLPDDFFKHGLKEFEAPYKDAAWEDMRSLLDKADRKRPFILWFRKNKKQTLTLITITMITSTIIAVLTMINSGAEIITKKTTATQPVISNQIQSTAKKSNAADDKFNGQNSPEKQPVNTLIAGSETQRETQTAAKMTGIKKLKTTAEKPGNNSVIFIQENKTDVNSDFVKMYESAESNEKTAVAEKNNTLSNMDSGMTKTVDPAKLTPGTIPSARYTTFRGPWMGIHFTGQEADASMNLDSFTQAFGFNWQLMSPNLTGRSDFGGHLGLDFGALWYGHGKHYGIVLDNTSLDSGFTRLSTHSFDIFARGHFEYARFIVKPYVNAFAGPRIFATSQYVKSYRPKTDYENSSNTNVLTTASLMYGAAIGARIAVSKHVSLDARYEFMMGTQTRSIDMMRSEFNGVSSFTLKQNIINPNYHQWKFGVLFDLWEERTTTTHKTTTEVVQNKDYYYFDSTTNQYIKVNCRCVETKNDITPAVKSHSSSGAKNIDDSADGVSSKTPQPSDSKGGVNISPGGSGKGSFPGIKPGGGGKIKN